MSENRNELFYRLIKKFDQKTGSGGTSFNVRGEPIVNTPQDAYRCFMATEMDFLVLENHVLIKSEEPSIIVHSLIWIKTLELVVEC